MVTYPERMGNTHAEPPHVITMKFVDQNSSPNRIRSRKNVQFTIFLQKCEQHARPFCKLPLASISEPSLRCEPSTNDALQPQLNDLRKLAGPRSIGDHLFTTVTLL
jgi:hypothetical protein